ncbi:MAG: hypothetical protein HY917_05335 [Candidatus Diapherotrites archaeon]|nr:hypothetical protein [Candidatus Diapherotrites archaeon]
MPESDAEQKRRSLQTSNLFVQGLAVLKEKPVSGTGTAPDKLVLSHEGKRRLLELRALKTRPNRVKPRMPR